MRSARRTAPVLREQDLHPKKIQQTHGLASVEQVLVSTHSRLVSKVRNFRDCLRRSHRALRTLCTSEPVFLCIRVFVSFKGPWVPTPTTWSNTYFRMLLDFEWEVWTGPGNHSQWRVVGDTVPTAPGVAPGGPREPIMMLTSDLSLLNDPEQSYQQYVQEFALDSTAFDEAFAAAWYATIIFE